MRTYPQDIVFVKLFAALAAGILLFRHLPLTNSAAGSLIALLVAAGTLAYFFRKRFRYRWLQGLLLLAPFTAAGMLLMLLHQPGTRFQDKALFSTQQTITLQLLETPVPGSYTSKAIARLTDTDARLLVEFQDMGVADSLRYGDVLVTRAKPYPIAPPANPYQFNAQMYWTNKGVTHRVRLKEGSWQLVARGQGNRLLQAFFQLNAWFADVLNRYVPHPQSNAVLKALVLGDKSALDHSVKTTFGAAGAMHVLAVSGLHVGIILLLVNWLLKPITHIHRLRWLRVAIVLLAVWSFAGVTGFSASVTRASVMFSFYLFGTNLQRKAHPINALAASAFFLLLIDPLMLFQVGFQLSYAAVLGILLLFPPLSEVFTFKWKATRWVWDLTAVSIAAQLGTLPLVCFYFHQYPTYSLLTNFVVIPAAFVLLLSALLLGALSWLPMLAKWFGLLLSNVVQWLIALLEQVQHLPGTLIEPVNINTAEVLLLFTGIAALCIWLFGRVPRALLAAALTGMLLSGSYTLKEYRQHQQRYLVVYNAGSSPAMEFIDGEQHVVLAGNRFTSEPEKLTFYAGEHWIKRGLPGNLPLSVDTQRVQTDFFQKLGPLGQLGTIRIAVHRENIKREMVEEKMPLNMLIISGSPKGRPEYLQGLYQFDRVVLDAGNSKSCLQRWQKACLEHHWNCYFVKAEGAFVWKVPQAHE